MVFLPVDDPGSPTGRQFSTVRLLESEDTWPMVLVPIATAFSGFSALLVVAACIGGGSRWARTTDAVCPPDESTSDPVSLLILLRPTPASIGLVLSSLGSLSGSVSA